MKEQKHIYKYSHASPSSTNTDPVLNFCGNFLIILSASTELGNHDSKFVEESINVVLLVILF